MKRITSYKNNRKFHTTLINFVYQFKCNKEEIISLSMISRLLCKSSNKYKDEALFLKERLNRYIINYSISVQSINEVNFLNFSLLIPNDNVVSDSDIKSQILYLLDAIYDNNLSDENIFNKEKRLMLESTLNNYKNIEFIAEKNLLDLLDSDAIFNKIKYKDIENINDLTLEDVLNLYNKYIKNIKPKIFVNGNIDINNLDNIIDGYLMNKDLKNIKLIKNYNNFYNNKLDSKYKIDKSNFYQSIVYEVYTINNYKEEDFYTLYLLNLLLSSSSSNLLMEYLRKKSNLVYTCSSSVMIKNGLLFIKAMTNKDNISLVKIIIKELLNDLKNIEKYKDYISNIINSYEINKEREKDNFFTISNNIINNYYKTDISVEEELKILKEIKSEDVVELLNRLEVVYEYTLEGEL